MPSTLSPRETEILALVADGLTSKAIAARLGISESTVNWHLANALRKLGASSRAAAVAVAMRDGILGTTSRPPEAIAAREPGRWQMMLAAVMTLMLATPLVITAAFLTLGDRAREPTRTEGPARPPAVSMRATPLASSTTGPIPTSAPTALTAAPSSNAPLPRLGPVPPNTPAPSATAASLPTAIATPTLPPPLTIPPLPTAGIELPSTSPALATPALPSPLASPLATPALPAPSPTLVPTLPLPSPTLVPSLPSVP